MRARLVFASVLIIAALAVTPKAGALISLLGVKNSMVEFLLDQLSTEGELVITADKVTEPEDGVTAIEGLKVSDAEGVWLTVDSLNFAWNSGRLLRGEVEFTNLAMAGVTVLRKPILPEAAPDETVDDDQDAEDSSLIAWPRSPLTVRIDRLAMERVSIEAPVLGHAITFDAVGAARDEGDVQSARLELERTDAVEGVIAFAYARNFSDNTLSVDLNASEAPGGLVAALADLPREAPSKVTLKADGPPTDWKMTFELAVAEMIAANGRAAISYQGPIQVDADFKARPGPRLAPELAALFGDEARLIALAQENADGLIKIERGELTSPHAGLTAKGTFDRGTGATDLALTLSANGAIAAPFEGVSFSDFRFDGTVEGAPGTYRARGALDLSGLRTVPADAEAAQLTIDVGQTGPEAQITTELDVSGVVRGLRLDKLPASLIGTADTQIVASLTGDALTLETFWLDSGVLNLSVSGDADIATTDAEIGFGLATPAMAEVAAAYGVTIKGAADVNGTLLRQNEITTVVFESAVRSLRHDLADAEGLLLGGTIKQSGPRTAFALNGTGTQVRLDRIGPDILDRADIALNGALEGSDLSVTLARVTAPLLKAEARGDLNTEDQTGDVTYRFSTPELGRVARLYDLPAAGRVSAEGRAVLAKQAVPQVIGTFEGSGLSWQGQNYGTVSVRHDVAVSDTPGGTIDARFSDSPYGTGRIGTGFQLTPPQLSLTALNADLLGVSARGDLKVDLDRTLLDGRLALSVPDLRRLRPVTGTAFAGSAKGTVRLTAPGRQDVKSDLALTGLDLGGAQIGSMTVRGSVRDALGRPVLDLDVRPSAITAEGVRIKAARLAAKGPMSRLIVSATADGTIDKDPLTARLDATINAAGQIIRATVSRLEAQLAKASLRQNGPLAIAVQGSTISARGLDLTIPGGGTVQGDAAYHGGPMSGDLRVSVPDFAALDEFVDVPTKTGALDVTAAFDTRRRRATVKALARDVRFEGVDAAGAMTLDAQADWKGRVADVAAKLEGDFGQPVQVTASVPVAVRGGLPALARRGPVLAAIAWTGRIDELWALVPAPGHVLTGQAVIDLGVSGDIADPRITGGARVEDGGYQNLDLGTILTDLTIATKLLPDGDLGLTLQASDGAKGTLTTEGKVALDASGLDIKATMDRAVLVRRDDITARIGGEIVVSGPMTDLLVAGKLTIQDAEARLVNANPPTIVELENVHIKGAPVPEDEAGSSTTRLQIDIDAPGRLFARGRGLDSEWKMGLKVRGTAAQPRVTGRMERVRGRLDLIGKGFDLKRGRIDFDGGAEIDPRIDIVLERATQDLTGRIVVDGLASDPQLSFSSTPSLPEDEVLPRVLFGKSSQALTGSQAIQLAIGIATLTDGGSGPLDAVRGAVGLDQLRVEQDEDGNASVAAGKEVAEGVWVGTKQNLGTNNTSVVVEIDVFDEITIDTEVEQGGDASIGIEWKRDF